MTNLWFVNEDYPAACKSKICGQWPGRECIFTANASICSAKNARNDVHAVISDLSLVLPILCQCSAPAVRPSAGGGLDVDGPSIDGETRLSTPKRLAEIFRQPQTVEKPKRGAKPFHTSIVPGGVYGGDGAIFAAENPIFQSENRFLAVSAPGNP